MASKFCTYK